MIVGDHFDANEAWTAWDRARGLYEQAVAGADDVRIAKTAEVLALRGAMLLAARNGVPLPPEGDRSPAEIDAMRRACRDWDPAGDVELAHNTFGTVARLRAMLGDPETKPRAATIMAAFVELGEKLVLLGLAIDGVWGKYARAAKALEGLSGGGKKKVVQWRQLFAPVARELCQGKSKVSLGELVRQARAWAERERCAGKKVFLPATDHGIEKGLKRLIEQGELIVPGWAAEG